VLRTPSLQPMGAASSALAEGQHLVSEISRHVRTSGARTKGQRLFETPRHVRDLLIALQLVATFMARSLGHQHLRAQPQLQQAMRQLPGLHAAAVQMQEQVKQWLDMCRTVLLADSELAIQARRAEEVRPWLSTASLDCTHQGWGTVAFCARSARLCGGCAGRAGWRVAS
jgi:hypothetical protein